MIPKQCALAMATAALIAMCSSGATAQSARPDGDSLREIKGELKRQAKTQEELAQILRDLRHQVHLMQMRLEGGAPATPAKPAAKAFDRTEHSTEMVIETETRDGEQPRRRVIALRDGKPVDPGELGIDIPEGDHRSIMLFGGAPEGPDGKPGKILARRIVTPEGSLEAEGEIEILLDLLDGKESKEGKAKLKVMATTCADCAKAGGKCDHCKAKAKAAGCADCPKAGGKCEHCKAKAKAAGCGDCAKAGGKCEHCKAKAKAAGCADCAKAKARPAAACPEMASCGCSCDCCRQRGCSSAMGSGKKSSKPRAQVRVMIEGDGREPQVMEFDLDGFDGSRWVEKLGPQVWRVLGDGAGRAMRMMGERDECPRCGRAREGRAAPMRIRERIRDGLREGIQRYRLRGGDRPQVMELEDDLPELGRVIEESIEELIEEARPRDALRMLVSKARDAAEGIDWDELSGSLEDSLEELGERLQERLERLERSHGDDDDDGEGEHEDDDRRPQERHDHWI